MQPNQGNDGNYGDGVGDGKGGFIGRLIKWVNVLRVMIAKYIICNERCYKYENEENKTETYDTGL